MRSFRPVPRSSALTAHSFARSTSAGIAALAFVALLAGRSEGAQFPALGFQGAYAEQLSHAPITANQMLSPSLSMSPFGRSVATKSASASPDGTCKPGAPCPRPKRCKKIGKSGPVNLFASEVGTGNVYEYCEDMPPNVNTPRLTSLGIGGWGLAVSPTMPRLAVGTRAGTVSIYNITPAGQLVAWGAPGKLSLGQPGAHALGLCFDSTGGLYATDYNTNEIDYFTNAEVNAAAAGQLPTPAYLAVDANNKPFKGYYLACDFEPGESPADIVMVDGVDYNGNVDVASFAGPSGLPNVTIEQPLAFGAANFPGGLTINSADHLVVSDTAAGVLVDLGGVEPWNFVSNDTLCQVPGFPTNEYLPIAFDDVQDEIWAGNIISAQSSISTDAVSNSYPFSQQCARGTSGGPTAVIPPNSEFLGVAVSPNTGN